MSKSEMSAEQRGERDPLASGNDGRDELKSMLDTIAEQLLDADRRHTAALNDMQDRISGMGREADTLRARVPDQFASAFEQIEAGIGELAHRLAEAGKSASNAPSSRGTSPSFAPEARSSTRGHPAHPKSESFSGDVSNPWDQQTADALARIYEAEDADLSARPPSSSTSSDPSGASAIDEAWLESRFAEIARGIEYSLANVKPESGFLEFGERLDQFERQFAKLFAGVATHDDLSAVQRIGAHMEEMVHHLERTNDQLDRLNTIEAQLADVSKILAGMQAASSSFQPANIDAVARAVAEETAQRVVEKNSAADELRPLIEQLMTENRQGGEHTAALLDTMQQAMVRLLDRVDTIEFTQPQKPRVFESQTPATYGETEYSGDAGRGDHFPFRHELAPSQQETGTSASFVETPVPPPPVGLFGSEMSPAEMANRSERLRQEFIADARRAKMRLVAEGDDLDHAIPLSVSMTASRAQDAVTPPGSRPIRPSAGYAKNPSGPSAPSPRLMLIAALVLIALAGLWYTFGFGNKAEPVAVRDVAPTSAPSSNDAGASRQSDGTKSAPPRSTEMPPASSSPGDGADKPVTPAPDSTNPHGDLGPRGENSAQDDASQPRTALPMLGVAVDLNEPISEAELQQARRHQAMANLSGELASAAARPGESAVVPASMVPSEAETEGSVPQSQGNANGGGQSGRLELPTAMVGPLSLRLAAANGDSSAQFEVGARFAEGEGVTQNFKEAAKWYQRSADQGFAQAQYRLGTLYERGLGLKPDRQQAANWYLRAAKQGNVKAMHNLAVLSANQTDRSPDYTTAAQWFEEAAKRGLPDSEYNLAILYENGLGVSRDLKQAFMWLSLAAQGGDTEAVRRRDILRGRLTAQDIEGAEKLIAAWRPAPTDRVINDALVAGELWKKNPKTGDNG